MSHAWPVVLDTNTLVSALIFRGRLSWLREAWQRGQVRPILCHATASELLRVLAYRKFRLDKVEIDNLLADLLPFTETVDLGRRRGRGLPRSRDPHDRVFLVLAQAACAVALVTGDGDLLALASKAPFPIWDADTFRNQLAVTD